MATSRMQLPRKRKAYTAVHDSRSAGEAGWYVGLFVEGIAGCARLALGYGPYTSYAAADWYASALNAGLGVTPDEAAVIVSSTTVNASAQRP
jgi:hypothetical protein